jgi:hypothetical protein
MPQRFLRPGLRTSERFNSVCRDAQILYIAILTVVDDYGRYDGRPSVLHGDAFSVWNEKNPEHAVNPQRTAALCGELEKAMLVHFYEVEGKKCLQMIQWEERIRDGAKEKWPKANESDIPQESAAFRSVPLPPSSPPSPSPAPAPEAPAHFQEAEIPSWEEFWAHCQTQACLIAAEWYAKDKWLAAEQINWSKMGNWKAYAQRCKSWWESDGRPMKQEKSYGKNNSKHPAQHIDRSIGTLNEGRASDYEGLGRVVKVPNKK